MKLRRLSTTAFAAVLAIGTGAAMAQGYPQQQNYPQQQQNGYPQQQGQPPYGDRGPGGWDVPPTDFRTDIARQGFREGVQGARQDFESRRQPNPSQRPEFRHPPVPRGARNEYRDSFRRGYDVGMRHMLERRDEHRDDHRDDRRDDRRDGYPQQPR